MSDGSNVDDLSQSLEELIGDHLSRLTEKLQDGASIAELADEVGRLNDLLISYKLRDELLERLLDNATSEARRNQILETLDAQRMKVARNQAEVERIHSRSHDILNKSAQVIATIQRQINKNAHKHSGYELEMCGFCEGFGRASEKTCPVCRGRRTVLVYQPATKCQRCNGVGKATIDPVSLSSSALCIACRGTGWSRSIQKSE
ncbi:MAG TPA: hypothetical protein VKN18_22515 [Blastocatellia bacterium]|nr:hypothetical protein [Blastocatellia bacterium]